MKRKLDLSWLSLSEVEAIYGKRIAIKEEERRLRVGVSYEYEKSDTLQGFNKKEAEENHE